MSLGIFRILIVFSIMIGLCGCSVDTTYSDCLSNCIDEPIEYSFDTAVYESNEIIERKIEEIKESIYKYSFDESQDLQLPELPTGCEATALTTLLRMNSIEVAKLEVADAMPKNYDGNFVYSFWGDPYSSTGWACMAPCSVRLANEFLENSSKEAVELTGIALLDLPLPSAVWVTIDLGYPSSAGMWQDGYPLFYNTHCMVVTEIIGDVVKVVDPLVGVAEYEFDNFEYVYNTLGSQAVHIKNI